jgi:branched-chain amino acid transport system ATP-binding protein
MSALLELAGIGRRFGGLVAVDAIDLTVSGGEVRGLIGPNGAGKTTLLDLIGGQRRPSSGRVIFGGTDITGLRADQRAAIGICRTFQNLKLFRDMTVLENVMIGLHAQTRSEMLQALLRTRAQRQEEARMVAVSRQALAAVGLLEEAGRSAAALPYGHRRLLEIARAIVSRPRLLLLDEPAAGLNPAEAAALVRLIRRIQSEGVAIILVEHHLGVVMTACERITVLNYGRRLAEGSPKDIRDHPDVQEAYLGRDDLYERIAVHA